MHSMFRHYALHAVFAAAVAALGTLVAGVWAVVAIGEPVWPSLLSGSSEDAWQHNDELSVLVLIITATLMFVALYGFAVARILVSLKRQDITSIQGAGWQLLVPSILAIFTSSVLGVMLQVLFWLVAIASVWPLLAAWRVARPFKAPKIRD